MITFLNTSHSLAVEIYENTISTRALGMGNAFSAVVDDYTALWYNPAGLDKVRGMHLTLIDGNLGTDALDIANVVSAATGGNFLTLIQTYYGRQVWTALSDSMAFSTQGLAIGAFDFFNMSLNIHNPAYSNVELNATNDYGISIGGALGLIPKIWRMGISFKRLTRFGGRVLIGPSSVATLSNGNITSQISNMGTGYGMDAGMLFTIPVGLKPTVSFVWHDIGQTKFIPASGAAPPVLDNEAVLGFAALIEGPLFKIKPALDIKHATLWEEPLGKRVHLGIEFQFPAISARIGANQGYYTAGLSANIGLFKIEAATYGVELGVYPGHTEDRRYMLNVGMDINISPFSGDDPDAVNGSSGAGKGLGPGRRSSTFQRR